jgi:hypothetical protein
MVNSHYNCKMNYKYRRMLWANHLTCNTSVCKAS